MKGSTTALVLVGGYFALKSGALNSILAAPATAAAATANKPTLPTSGAAGKPPAGAPAGQGAGATAGRGGAPKTGGGIPLDDFYQNTNESLIAQMIADQQSVGDIVPDFTFFQEGNANQIVSGPSFTDIITFQDTGGGVPQFGGDQNLIDPTTGLVIDPATGSPFGESLTDPAAGPDIVDLTDQVPTQSAIFPPEDSPDLTPIDTSGMSNDFFE